MTFLIILLLGIRHGLQPDHQAAVLGVAARTGTSAWRAGLRLAFGHAGALVVVALLLQLVPRGFMQRIEGSLNAFAGAGLVVLGAALLLQAWRARYVVHAHAHRHARTEHEHLHTHPVAQVERHEHKHARGALGLGLVLGLGGAQGTLSIVPYLDGRDLGLLKVALYCGGVAVGGVGLGVLVDRARTLVRLRPALRWVDLGVGMAALALGAHLVYGAFA